MYKREELEDAFINISSLRNKCIQSHQTLQQKKQQSSQQSLLYNRIQALDVALDLIEQQLSEISN